MCSISIGHSSLYWSIYSVTDQVEIAQVLTCIHLGKKDLSNIPANCAADNMSLQESAQWTGSEG